MRLLKKQKEALEDILSLYNDILFVAKVCKIREDHKILYAHINFLIQDYPQVAKNPDYSKLTKLQRAEIGYRLYCIQKMLPY